MGANLEFVLMIRVKFVPPESAEASRTYGEMRYTVVSSVRLSTLHDVGHERIQIR